MLDRMSGTKGFPPHKLSASCPPWQRRQCRRYAGNEVAMPWLAIIMSDLKYSTVGTVAMPWLAIILSDIQYSTVCRVQKASHRTNSVRPAHRGNGGKPAVPARHSVYRLSGIFCSPQHKLTAARSVRQRRYCRRRTLFQPPHATPLQVLRPHRHA